MQAAILIFCYGFIGGLVAARFAPADSSFLSFGWLITALLLVTAVAIRLIPLRASGRKGAPAPDKRWIRLSHLVLLLGAAALGYTRHLDANTIPDSHLADIVIESNSARAIYQAQLPETCRLRIRKQSPLEADVHLRLTGEVDARIAARDEQGRAQIDRQGRWLFYIVRRTVTTEVVVIRAGDPIGTDYVIDQPLTRLTGLILEKAPSKGVLALYRISNHISAFTRPGRAQSPVTILGRISSDPLVYEFKTVLPVTPEFIQYPAGGPFYRVEGGEIQVTIRPDLSGYERFATTAAYGHDVEIVGELTFARGAANPGGFDARRYLQNHNIYGLMSLFSPREGPPPIRIIEPVDGPAHRGNPLVSFSLRLRDDVLRVLKQTIPFPQSAFVGGVTLGLRYGLQGVECLFSATHERLWEGRSSPWPVGQFCEETIADEFRAAGVNHVLAVSGLHVTILSAMFIAIFTLMRLPRQAYVPLVIVILIIFAIITGARPSTVRAVIMNSLFMMTWAYLDQSLRSSILIGVPVAAFLILLHNPMVLTDPSFTLSFGAILSLGLLTNPILELLQRLRGNTLAAALAIGGVFSLVAIVHWPLAISFQFLAPFALVSTGLMVWLNHLQRRGKGLPESFQFAMLPEPVGAFLAAQLAIQLGMMVPLSAAYFARWPFGGAYANLLAIPLIGVVVQLGAIGGLLGLIPGIGIYLALLLGAANWLFSSVFLWLAHVSAERIPFPFVRQPGLPFLLAYYAALAWFIWRRPFNDMLMRWTGAWGAVGRWLPPAAGIVILVTTASVMAHNLKAERPTGLRITVLSVGYGSSIFVESPGGRRILIDGGFVEHERGRRNEAIRSILPYLSHRKIRALDAVLLVSPRPERAGGLAHVIDHTWVKEVFVPPSLAGLSSSETLDAFSARFVDADSIDTETLSQSHQALVGNPDRPRRRSLAMALSDRAPTLLNRFAGAAARIRTLTAGDVLFEEHASDGIFRIEVLSPPADSPVARSFDNGSLVLRVVYGDFAMLITGDLDFSSAAALSKRLPSERLNSQVITLPHRGAALDNLELRDFRAAPRTRSVELLGHLIEAAKPERIIAEWGPPRPVLGNRGRDAITMHEAACRFISEKMGNGALLSTARDLAIIIESDGRSYRIQTQAEILRAAGGMEDAVSDLAVMP